MFQYCNIVKQPLEFEKKIINNKNNNLVFFYNHSISMLMCPHPYTDKKNVRYKRNRIKRRLFFRHF